MKNLSGESILVFFFILMVLPVVMLVLAMVVSVGEPFLLGDGDGCAVPPGEMFAGLPVKRANFKL